MSWNYRFFKLEGYSGEYINLREVYYEDGEIEAWSAEPCELEIWGSQEEAREEFTKILKALDKEILVESELIEKLKSDKV